MRRQEAGGVVLGLPGAGESLLGGRLGVEARVAAPGAGEPLGVVLGGEAPCAVPGLEAGRFVPDWTGAGRVVKGLTWGGSGDGLGSAGFLRTRSVGPPLASLVRIAHGVNRGVTLRPAVRVVVFGVGGLVSVAVCLAWEFGRDWRFVWRIIWSFSYHTERFRPSFKVVRRKMKVKRSSPNI